MAVTDRIEGLTTSQAIKAPVKAATTANITLSAAQTIDGVSIVAGDRVLVKNQTTGTEDGIYLCQTGTWTRAKDWNGSRDGTQGTLITVKGGTVNTNTLWRSGATDDPYVIGTVDPGFVLAEYLIDVSGRMTFTFDSSTGMSADPGDGDFRLNNATIASATAMVFSNNSADSGSPDVSDFMMSWDDSTNAAHYGTVTISELGAPEIFATFSITGTLTDGTTYVDLGTVAYVNGAGAFTAASKYVVQFARTGNLGAAGGGTSMLWETATTDTDQGAGKVWLDNGTVASATVFYVDDVNVGATSINSYVDSWDDSSNRDVRGTIMVLKPGSPENYHIFNVTGVVTSASTYSKVAVTHVSSGGTISDGDSVLMTFVRAGQKGISAGVQMKWDVSTTDTDQGAGTVWMDAAPASATIVYLDDVDDAAAASINSWVDSFDDSTATISGHIKIQKMSDPAIWALFNVTGVVTSASTYSKIAVTYVTGAGSFSADDQVSVHFTRSGDNGGGGTMSNWVEDTTPQAGGTVDMNGFDLQFDDDTSIEDDSGNRYINFQKTASAVNYVEFTNAATGVGPTLGANSTGDTNVDMNYTTKGDGVHNFAGAAVRTDIVALTSTSNSIAIDLADGNFFSHTLVENSSLANPSNMPVGKTQEFTIFLSQNTTAYTMGLGSFYTAVNGATAILVSTAVSVEDRLDCIVKSSTAIQIVISKGIS